VVEKFGKKNPIIRGFNELHGPEGWAIKPLNAAQCGANSDTWWVNMLLIFDVDGTDYAKDRSFFASRKKKLLMTFGSKHIGFWQKNIF
jgi:hypothetical protein